MQNFGQLTLAEKWDFNAQDYEEASENATGQYFPDIISSSGLLEQEPTNDMVKILDIAGGNGLLARKIFNSLKNDTKWNKNNFYFCSTDFSTTMVQVAKQKMDQIYEREDLKQGFDFKVMDGQHLSAETNSFDIAFSCFGMFMFPNRKKGLEEMYRVLKPGGKAIVSSWTTFHFQIGGGISQKVMSHPEMQKLKHLFKQQTISVGFQEENAIREEFTAVGFKNIIIHKVTHHFIFPSAKEYTQLFKTNPFSLSSMINFTTEERNNYYDIYEKTVNELYFNSSSNQLEVPSQAFITTAEK